LIRKCVLTVSNLNEHIYYRGISVVVHLLYAILMFSCSNTLSLAKYSLPLTENREKFFIPNMVENLRPVRFKHKYE